MHRIARKTLFGLFGLGVALGLAPTSNAATQCVKIGTDHVAIIDVCNDPAPVNSCGGVGTTEISFEVYVINGGCSATSGLYVRCQNSTAPVLAFLCNRLHNVRVQAPFPWGLPGGTGGCSFVEYSD